MAKTSSATNSEEMPLEQAFREEILDFFNIPKDEIPATRSSQELLAELPILDLKEQATEQASLQEIPENFSFLDYLLNQDIL